MEQSLTLFQKRDDMDELDGFQQQELAKVKHMVCCEGSTLLFAMVSPKKTGKVGRTCIDLVAGFFPVVQYDHIWFPFWCPVVSIGNTVRSVISVIRCQDGQCHKIQILWNIFLEQELASKVAAKKTGELFFYNFKRIHWKNCCAFMWPWFCSL